MNPSAHYHVPPEQPTLSKKRTAWQMTLSLAIFMVCVVVAAAEVWAYVDGYAERGPFFKDWWSYAQWYIHAWSFDIIIAVLAGSGFIVAGISLLAQLRYLWQPNQGTAARATSRHRRMIKTIIVVPGGLALLYLVALALNPPTY
jgi:hypothetical protein